MTVRAIMNNKRWVLGSLELYNIAIEIFTVFLVAGIYLIFGIIENDYQSLIYYYIKL